MTGQEQARPAWPAPPVLGRHPARGPGPPSRPVPVEPRIGAEAEEAVPGEDPAFRFMRKPVLPLQGITPGREGLPAVSPAGEKNEMWTGLCLLR